MEKAIKKQQILASFYFMKMKRAANFSVPGSEKTATMYGTFSYISSSEINEINKMVVIGPLNAFEAWKTEFEATFGSKRVLEYMSLKNYDDIGKVRMN